MGKVIDLVGQKFGRLKVVERAENNKQGNAMWLCRCECGNQIIVLGVSLRSGNTKSCGCLRKEQFMLLQKSRLINLVGKRFGRLTVLRRAENDSHGRARWHCRCDCGNEIDVSANNLKRITRSCGCLSKEIILKRLTTHGQSSSRLFYLWQAMKSRTKNPNHKLFERYGGRGITVCEEWLSFENFYEWAITTGYRDNLSLDRINVNGHYCPENCRWADMKTQQNNRSNNRHVSFGGKTQTVAQWADELELPAKTIYRRLSDGWTIEEALTTPVGGKRKSK